MGVVGQSHAKMSVRFFRCLASDVTNRIQYLVNGEISYFVYLCELSLQPQFLYQKKQETAKLNNIQTQLIIYSCLLH
jgi:hypothetical protein